MKAKPKAAKVLVAIVVALVAFAIPSVGSAHPCAHLVVKSRQLNLKVTTLKTPSIDTGIEQCIPIDPHDPH